MSQTATTQLTVSQHLHELWLRCVTSIAFMAVGGVFAYVFRLPIINFLQRPLHEQLYYTSPTGGFQFVMQLCLLFGFVATLPVSVYNLLRFIAPALPKLISRRRVVTLLAASTVLVFVGLAFAYYISLPAALHFFGTVGTDTLHPLISINQYFSFVVGYMATFAIVFQLPLLLLFVNFVHPFGPGGLRKNRKYVYVGAFAIALVLPSAPDPLSQVILAVPIIALYEVSVIAVWFANRSRHRSTPQPRPVVNARQYHAVPQQSVTTQRIVPVVPLAVKPEGSVSPTTQSRQSRTIDGVIRGRTRARTVPRANYQVSARAAPLAPSSQKIISDFV